MTIVKILFLAADPANQVHLRMDKEAREIQNQLQSALQQANFDFKMSLAVRPVDLTRDLQREQPDIVHFSGHGGSHGEIFLEDDAGYSLPVHPEALTNLFALLKKHVQCVVLNACYSQQQAEAISKHIPYVIGMKQAISDAASIAFSIGFYQALGNGRTLREAFEFGRVQVGLQWPQEQGIPELLTQEMVALSQAVSIVNNMADAVGYVLQDKPDPQTPQQHSNTMEGRGSKVVRVEGGRDWLTITYQELDRLPPELRDHIHTYEEAMKLHYQLWQKLYPQRGLSPDPKANQEINDQLKQQIANMKEDFVGILDTLHAVGFYLDDHFIHIRQLIEKVKKR